VDDLDTVNCHKSYLNVTCSTAYCVSYRIFIYF